MHRLELSCKTQIAAMSCNTKLIEVPAEVVEATYMNFQPHVAPPVRRARLAGAAAEARPDRSGLPRLIGYTAQLRTGLRRRRVRLLDRAGLSFRRLAADGRHGGAGRRQCRHRALAQHLESRLLQRPGEARSGAALRAARGSSPRSWSRRASPSPSSSTSSAACRSTGGAGCPRITVHRWLQFGPPVPARPAGRGNRQSRRPHRRGYPRLDRIRRRVRPEHPAMRPAALHLPERAVGPVGQHCRSSSFGAEFDLPGYMVWAPWPTRWSARC